MIVSNEFEIKSILIFDLCGKVKLHLLILLHEKFLQFD